MRKVLVISLLFSFQLIFPQTKGYEIYYSEQYEYQVEYPSGFSPREKTVQYVDFVAADGKGSTIAIVIKPLKPQEDEAAIFNLLAVPEKAFEANLQLPGADLLKRGMITIAGIKGIFYDYTSKEADSVQTIHYTNYSFVNNRHLFTITTTCDLKVIAKMRPVFQRVVQSFTFPK